MDRESTFKIRIAALSIISSEFDFFQIYNKLLVAHIGTCSELMSPNISAQHITCKLGWLKDFTDITCMTTLFSVSPVASSTFQLRILKPDEPGVSYKAVGRYDLKTDNSSTRIWSELTNCCKWWVTRRPQPWSREDASQKVSSHVVKPVTLAKLFKNNRNIYFEDFYTITHSNLTCQYCILLQNLSLKVSFSISSNYVLFIWV